MPINVQLPSDASAEVAKTYRMLQGAYESLSFVMQDLTERSVSPSVNRTSNKVLDQLTKDIQAALKELSEAYKQMQLVLCKSGNFHHLTPRFDVRVGITDEAPLLAKTTAKKRSKR